MCGEKSLFIIFKGDRIGITPAYAGKRDLVISGSGDIEDHPRVCGEKVSSTSPIKCLKGSPPRVRGKVRPGVVRGHEGGITPAYAGKRVHSELEGPRSEDHPRVCGEKHTHLNGTFLNLGSPPRMRGKAPLLSKAPSECGITPAYAGKSDYRCVTAQAYWDHPRVCGEKRQQHYILWSLSGSPPRMRGKVLLRSGPDAWGRITPAYAGKRALPCRWPYRRRDHPRVCGEKACMQCTLQGHGGSPPRMRGKGQLLRCMVVRFRITPAYAGKRLSVQ